MNAMRGQDGAYCGVYATVDGRAVAVRRSEAKAQRGPSTTRSTEADEPLAGNDLPDDWFHCANCGKDCDPAEVKREYSDMELCGEECTAERIKSLEQDLVDRCRVSELRGKALQEIVDASEHGKVAATGVWMSVSLIREIAIKGLYLIKEDAPAKTNAQPQPVVATKPIEVA